MVHRMRSDPDLESVFGEEGLKGADDGETARNIIALLARIFPTHAILLAVMEQSPESVKLALVSNVQEREVLLRLVALVYDQVENNEPDMWEQPKDH